MPPFNQPTAVRTMQPSSEIDPDKLIQDPRITSEYMRAETICKDWARQLQGIQDLLIIGPEDTGKWLVEQRHKYRGIQKAAATWLQYLPDTVKEGEKKHLAAMLKLTPSGKVIDGRVEKY
jgi:hypothetical protein